jgi:hypothetical protein
MKILIEQDCTGTGRFWWKIKTGPEHIDSYCGYADTLGEAFEEIVKRNTLNATRYFGE